MLVTSAQVSVLPGSLSWPILSLCPVLANSFSMHSHLLLFSSVWLITIKSFVYSICLHLATRPYWGSLERRSPLNPQHLFVGLCRDSISHCWSKEYELAHHFPFPHHWACSHSEDAMEMGTAMMFQAHHIQQLNFMRLRWKPQPSQGPPDRQAQIQLASQRLCFLLCFSPILLPELHSQSPGPGLIGFAAYQWNFSTKHLSFGFLVFFFFFNFKHTLL